MATLYWKPTGAVIQSNDPRRSVVITVGIYSDAGFTNLLANAQIVAEPTAPNQLLLDMARQKCIDYQAEQTANTAAQDLVTRVLAYPGKSEVV